MEKKTIGRFICALRKASGMTQRQLADKLLVSDKSVSRWERDECLPDLTLIPAIADIFGVTTDELLRGERRNIDSEPSEEGIGLSQRSLKQIAVLTKRIFTSYLTRSIISCALALLALVSELIFYDDGRMVFGHILAAFFLIPAVTLQIVSCIKAFSAFSGEELADQAEPKLFNRLFSVSAVSFSFIGICTLFILPFVLILFIPIGSAHIGAAVLSAILCPLCCSLAKRRFVKNGKYFMTDEEKERYLKLAKLSKKYILGFMITVCVLLVLQLVLFFAKDDICFRFSKKEVFTSVDKFISYVQTPIDAEGDEYEPDDDEFYDTVEIEKDGKEISVNQYNESIYSYGYVYSSDGSSVQSVNVITRAEYAKFSGAYDVVFVIIFALYAVAAIVTVTAYLIQKKKLKKQGGSAKNQAGANK